MSPLRSNTTQWFLRSFITSTNTVKVNHPKTGHEGLEGKYIYSSTLSLTSALDGVGGQRQDPAAVTPEKGLVTYFTEG